MRGKLVFLFFVLLLLNSHVLAQKSEGGSYRIGIREVDGRGEFYEMSSGKRFVIRGTNYLHLEVNEQGNVEDTLFAPSRFEAEQVAAELHGMRALGYNTIRVALDICQTDCITSQGGGIRPEFMDNLAVLLNLARQEGLFVILMANDFPVGSFYAQRMEAQCCTTFDGYMNTQYLSPVGVATWREYWQTIVRGLIDRAVPMDVILAYSLRNEMFFLSDQPPLSLQEGAVAGTSGSVYNMTDPEQKRQMVAEGAVFWLNTMRDAIREIQPEALVTVGLFAPNQPNNWRGDDPRVALSLAVLGRSEVDFFDIHPYPGTLSLPQLMENFQINGLSGQPVIMGEFGAFRSHYAEPALGALGLRDWQIESCQYGMQGWLHWHWMGENDLEMWTGTDEGGLINAVLAPVNRPDPCAEGNFVIGRENLALGRPVTVSAQTAEEPAENLVDGTNAAWGSGAAAWQWAEVQLDQPTRINRVVLRVAQSPNGPSRHRVWGIQSDGSYVLLHEINRPTRDGETLAVVLTAPVLDVVAIRVDTFESVSWVAWQEIEVYEGGIGEACIARAESQIDLRLSPDPGADPLGFLAEGRSAIVNQRAVGADGATWYHLPYGVWVSESDVTLSGDCDALSGV